MMRLEELLKKPIMEMSYSRKKAESIIMGLEKPINNHLLKLMVVIKDRAEQHWQHELSIWCIEIAEIRLKPSNKPAKANFYYEWLFDGPYGGNEERYVQNQIKRLSDQYMILTDFDTLSIAQRLQKFHKDFADQCASGTFIDASVKQFVVNFGGL